MKHIARLSLILAAMAAAPGCIILEGGDDNTTTDVNITWQVMTGGQASACPPGYTEAQVTVRPIGTDASADVVRATASCSEGTVTVLDLRRDAYEIYIELTDSNHVAAVIASAPVSIDLRSQDVSPHLEIHTDKGLLQYAWVLQRISSNQPLTCANLIEASRVRLSAGTTTQPTVSFVDHTPCEAAQTYSRHTFPGRYRVAIGAVNSADALQGPEVGASQDTGAMDFDVKALNAVTNMGTFVLLIDDAAAR